MAQIFRNPLFRKRRFKIELVQLIIPGPVQNVLKSFELQEVSSVGQETTAPTAIMPGMIAALIQPWYFQPTIMNVTGKSYIGAFSRGTAGNININIDRDIENLKDLRRILNERFETTRAIRDILFRVTFDDPDDSGNLSINDSFVGVVDNIGIDDGESDPYIRAYRFRFVGHPQNLVAVNTGTTNREKDKGRLDKIQTPSVIEEPFRDIGHALV